MTADTSPQALREHFSPIEAEQGVIGKVLRDNSLMPALGHLKPQHFIEPAHGRIWRAILDQVAQGRTADRVSVGHAMRNDVGLQDLSQSAGADYLQALFAPHASIAASMADIVLDSATRRAIVDIAGDLTTAATEDFSVAGSDLLGRMRGAIEQIEAEHSVSQDEFRAATDVAASALANLAETLRTGRTLGKRTGLRCVDYRLGGFRPGTLTVVGGRPGMGKTALARALAHGAAAKNPKDAVLFLGIEMGPEEMMHRELSAISHEMKDGVEFRDMSRGTISPYDLEVLQRAQIKVPANLIFRDCPSLGVNDVRRSAWAIKQKQPLAVIVIDYLQLMKRPDAKGRNEASVLGEMTAGLKQIAREAGCAILLLSQLSRQVEQRDDKVPQLSDLRESGSIEQDADAVLFPFRESYYLERAKPKPGLEMQHDMEVARLQHVLEVYCAKNRQGAVGKDEQIYRAEYDHITDVPSGDAR